MKDKVPRSFTVGGQDFKVKYGKEISEGNFGHTEYFQNEVVVKSHYNGKPYNKQQQVQCFYHELVHVILMTMNEHELNSNEQFVDIFGQFFYQFMKTAKWK